MEKKVYTKGNVIVNEIKIGDIHYEFEYGCGIKCEVISLPIRTKSGDYYQWSWQSKNLKTGNVIDYLITEGLSHYGPNLYDYEAYHVKHWL